MSPAQARERSAQRQPSGAKAHPSRWRRPLSMRQRENLHGIVLTSPSLVVLTVVVIIPFIAVVIFAFADIRLVDIPTMSLGDIDWTLDNFRRAIQSGAFWSALNVTLIYSGATTIGVIITGLAVSLAMRHPFRGRGVVRALLLIPYVLPVVAGATVWRTMLNPQYGLINAIGMEYFGWERPISFLSTTSTEVAGVTVPVALTTVIAFEIWKTMPLAFLFITARLQSIPNDIEEAAAIDGANSRQILFRIILPQLRNVILLLILLRFIWSFQSFNDIYLLTGGSGGTEVMAIKVYTELITRANIGSAAAYGLLMSAILLVLLAVYVVVSRRKE